MVEEGKKLDFPHNSLGVDQVFERVMHLLDGHLAVVLLVLGRHHNAIRSSTDQLDVLVVIVHYKSSS